MYPAPLMRGRAGAALNLIVSLAMKGNMYALPQTSQYREVEVDVVERKKSSRWKPFCKLEKHRPYA